MRVKEQHEMNPTLDENTKDSTPTMTIGINIDHTYRHSINDDNDFLDYRNAIYWRLLFLNLVILWAYQSLISAQNYYITSFPDDHLDFWGTVAAGTAMFLFHVFQLYFGIYKYGFTKRVLPGYIGYILIAVLVMSIKNAYLLIFSFAGVGALNTFTESPVYGIAGLFSTGIFTQAVQVGNGLAGFLNVLCNTIIRLIIHFSGSSIDQDQLSFYVFMSLLILLCFIAIYQYFSLIRLPPVARRMEEQMQLFRQEREKHRIDEVHLDQNEPIQLSFWQLCRILKVHLFVQFYVLFISLLLWPGSPCSATKNGWFSRGGQDWWCSPFVIGTFNLGDLLGRTVAVKIHRYFSSKTCFISSLLRTLFLLTLFYRNQMSNILLLCFIALMSFSNGLLATVTFMARPATIVGVQNCERAAYLMTAALYAGIACGSIFAAILSLTSVI